MKINLRYLLLFLLIAVGSYKAIATEWDTINSCTLNDISSSESIKLNTIHSFKNSKNDLEFDKYLIKTSNDLVMKVDLFINKNLVTSISFDSDIRYRYKAFLYESESKEQSYKLIVMEMIARDDDSDGVDGYYVYVLNQNKVITHFHMSDPIPIYDYYYLANYDNYHEMDKHNVTEYLSAFINNNIVVLVLNKKVWKSTDSESTSHLKQDDNNIHLCKKIN